MTIVYSRSRKTAHKLRLLFYRKFKKNSTSAIKVSTLSESKINDMTSK